MSRRRYVSTDISLDIELDGLAKLSDFAALLYTWMLPHVEEDATITGDPRRLKAIVLPLRDDVSASDVEAALELIEAQGLLELWSRATKTYYLRPETFYKYQTVIQKDKRRSTPASEIERQRTPENATSPSPSPTPSPSPLPTPSGSGGSGEAADVRARIREAPGRTQAQAVEQLRREIGTPSPGPAGLLSSG